MNYSNDFIFNIKEINNIVMDYKKHMEWSKYLKYDDENILDWKKTCSENINLPIEFIDFYFYLLPKNILVIYQKLPEYILRKYKYHFNWDIVCYYQVLSSNFLDEMNEFIRWSTISRKQYLDNWFIEKYYDKLDWVALSKRDYLPVEIIEKFENRCYFHSISVFNKKLTREFVDKYYDILNIDFILEKLTITEDFIEKHKHKFEWSSWLVISRRFPMTKKFALKYKDKLSWLWIARYQRQLPKEFILNNCPLIKYESVKSILTDLEIYTL